MENYAAEDDFLRPGTVSLTSQTTKGSAMTETVSQGILDFLRNVGLKSGQINDNALGDVRNVSCALILSGILS